ncbi:MAG: ABC transporter permease [Proteobacteria bacterium]|nr:ABC transporter permease [Pseudomonadota bacterium]
MRTFKLAWRNVWRNRRRSIVTIAAMSLALLVMILYSGLVKGYLEAMERNILDLEIGDIQIFADDYRENPSVYTRIGNPQDMLDELDGLGFKSSARLLTSGLAAAGDSSAGVALRGVNPERDAEVSLVHKQVMNGKWLSRSAPNGVVLGRRLARNLGAKPEDEIVVLTQGADGSMANELYNVRGVLKSIGDATDRAVVFMLDDTFRELMIMPEGAHQIIVRKPDQTELNTAAAVLRNKAPNLDVKTWRELLPTLSTMLESTSGMLVIMFCIVYIAIGIVILNAMLMAVFERIREFGVLKALGMKPGRVLRLILAESAVQTSVAILVGVSLSIPCNWFLTTVGIDVSGLGDISIAGIAWNSIWRSSVDANTYIGPIVTLVSIVFIAVLYPAIKAALIRPVAAIYHR